MAELPEERKQRPRIRVHVRRVPAGQRPEPLVAEPVADVQAEMDGGAREILPDLVALERPARHRHPRPALEIDRVERRAPAAPGVRTSTEDAVAHLPLIEDARAPDILDLVQGVGRCVPLQAAAFEHGDPQSGMGQLPSQRTPGGAGPDDADITCVDQLGLSGTQHLISPRHRPSSLTLRPSRDSRRGP
jgi:hypothetical protein